ncbi:MAG TPA: GNAT family N-acetyltransferase [bacterium]|nr:GNAT family N-acetyltransferase [bacterium]HPR89018.1 GNAT family N-acetyltransferase [bacterium]
MEERRSWSTRVTHAAERARTDGVLMVSILLLRQVLEKIGIYFNPFYYMREQIPAAISPELKELEDGLEFSVFGRDELEVIAHHSERCEIAEAYVYGNYNAGDTCLGCKCGGEIAGFSWYSLTASRDWYYKAAMKENEAYLFDMFVFKAYRRRQISQLLRIKCYQQLRSMGRDTCYSISDYTNRASLEFKKKLQAQKVFLGLHLQFGEKWQRSWVLKRYPV